MPFVLTSGKFIFFAHVPKTGGSSVEDYLVRRFGPLAMVDTHKRNHVGGTGLISPVTHLSALDLLEIVPANADLCFGVIRDPLKRIISEYRWQSGNSRMSRLEFSTWLRVVIAAARQEPRIYENHIRPQAEMIPDNAEVFRLEDGFDQMIARINSVTGFTAPNVEMGHLLKRKSTTPVTVSREDAELVADYYAVDYDRFAYARPDLASFEPDRSVGRRALLAKLFARLLVAKQHRDWMR